MTADRAWFVLECIAGAIILSAALYHWHAWVAMNDARVRAQIELDNCRQEGGTLVKHTCFLPNRRR